MTIAGADRLPGLWLALFLCAPGLGALESRPAAAQAVDCNRMALQIASLARNSGSARMQAAAEKQRDELARTAAYARSIGCDRPQFLFFGDRPPQCTALNARVQQMQANYAQLQRAALGDSGLKQQLQNQYEVYCRGGQREPNFIDRLFGQPDVTYPPEDGPPRDDQQDAEKAPPQGGPMAVCVRTCDGGWFPVTYSARRADIGDLQQLCTALCPNTEAKIYTRALSRDMKSAVSAEGESYSDLPNAFKFERTFDKACTCKPKDKSWVEALADAEKLLGEGHKSDILVTQQKADELSRPKQPGPSTPPAEPRRKFDPKAMQRLLDQKRVDAEAAATPAPGAGRDATGSIFEGDRALPPLRGADRAPRPRREPTPQ